MPASAKNYYTQRAEQRFLAEAINAPLLSREYEHELVVRRG